MVMRLSDRVMAMDNGKVISEGTPAMVRNDPKVIVAYHGHSTIGGDEPAEASLMPETGRRTGGGAQ